MARISAAGEMTIAVKFDVPGFGLTGLSVTPVGFDVNLAEIIAGKLGIDPGHIKWVEGLASLREEVLQRGEVDMVIATYTINAERAKSVTFAGPYYTAGQQLMVASTDTKITGPESLKQNPDAKVCTNTGSTGSVNIQPYLASQDQLVLFDVTSKCADALRTGQIQAVIDDNTNLLGLASLANGAFKLVGTPFTSEPYGIGVPKGHVDFCTFIDETLTEAAASGAYATAWEQTAGKIPGAQTPTLPKLDPCV